MRKLHDVRWIVQAYFGPPKGRDESEVTTKRDLDDYSAERFIRDFNRSGAWMVVKMKDITAMKRHGILT